MKDKNNLEPNDYTSGVSNTLNQPMKTELSPLEAFRRFRDNAKFDNKSDYYLSTQYIDDSDIIETALKNYEELLKIDCKQNTINDFYPNTKEMINDLLDLVSTKMCDFLKDGETYTKTSLLETLGFAVRYVKTFAYGLEFNETEKLGVNSKKLKAFDIIKEKGVDVGYVQEIINGKQELSSNTLTWACSNDTFLTEEEYDLLKEVLL